MKNGFLLLCISLSAFLSSDENESRFIHLGASHEEPAGLMVVGEDKLTEPLLCEEIADIERKERRMEDRIWYQ